MVGYHQLFLPEQAEFHQPRETSSNETCQTLIQFNQ